MYTYREMEEKKRKTGLGHRSFPVSDHLLFAKRRRIMRTSVCGSMANEKMSPSSKRRVWIERNELSVCDG